MDHSELQKLVELMNENGLVELEIEQEGLKVSLRKAGAKAAEAPPVAWPVAQGVPPVAAPAAPAPAAAAPAAPVAASGDLAGQLVAIVADRTGYPEDMLDLDVEMEAELGIDSIKKVEIIGAFRRAVTGEENEPPQWFADRMGAECLGHKPIGRIFFCPLDYGET